MNDYWNDPPEYPELPECCDDEMTFDEDTRSCVCQHCGRIIQQAPDIDPILEELPDSQP